MMPLMIAIGAMMFLRPSWFDRRPATDASDGTIPLAPVARQGWHRASALLSSGPAVVVEVAQAADVFDNAPSGSEPSGNGSTALLGSPLFFR